MPKRNKQKVKAERRAKKQGRPNGEAKQRPAAPAQPRPLDQATGPASFEVLASVREVRLDIGAIFLDSEEGRIYAPCNYPKRDLGQHIRRGTCVQCLVKRNDQGLRAVKFLSIID